MGGFKKVRLQPPGLFFLEYPFLYFPTGVAYHLTLIWVDFFGVHFEVGGGGGCKITPPPCLKLVRIMLETSNLARK